MPASPSAPVPPGSPAAGGRGEERGEATRGDDFGESHGIPPRRGRGSWADAREPVPKLGAPVLVVSNGLFLNSQTVNSARCWELKLDKLQEIFFRICLCPEFTVFEHLRAFIK